MEETDRSLIEDPELDDAPRQKKVLEVIYRNGRLAPSEIAELADMTPENVQGALRELKEDEKVKQPKYGYYDLVTRVPVGYDEERQKTQTNLAEPGPLSQEVGQTNRDPIYNSPASMGDGSLEIREDPIGYMPASQSLSSAGREVYWIPVRGDSMGDRYRMHSLVPVARFDEAIEDIQEDSVYHIRLEGAIQIKRLQRLPGQRIRIISDNDAYPNEILQLDEGIDFEILGQVLV